MSLEKSSKILAAALWVCALALTGCAGGRYHKIPVFTQAASVPGWSRPVDGTPISRYGETSEGVKLKGVRIRGASAAGVYAAGDGTVAWVDTRMEGYGQTVIVGHAPGSWTVYAHLGDIVVRQGQAVGRGEPLGRLDRVNPVMYFEWRREGRAEDPAKLWK